MKNPSLNEFLFGGTTEFPEGLHDLTMPNDIQDVYGTFQKFKETVKELLNLFCYCPIDNVVIDVDESNENSIHFELPDDKTLTEMYEDRKEKLGYYTIFLHGQSCEFERFLTHASAREFLMDWFADTLESERINVKSMRGYADAGDFADQFDIMHWI